MALLPSQGAISGRSRWSNMEKVCTSVNLSKACRQQEELGEGVGVGPRHTAYLNPSPASSMP